MLGLSLRFIRLIINRIIFLQDNKPQFFTEAYCLIVLKLMCFNEPNYISYPSPVFLAPNLPV